MFSRRRLPGLLKMPRRMFPLCLEADHRRLAVWVPPSIYRWRGAIVLILPALFVVLLVGMGLEGSLHTLSVGAIVLTAALIASFGAVGISYLVLARRLSRRTVAVFDRVSGMVRRAPPNASARLSEIAMVRVRHHRDGRSSFDLVGIDGILVTVLYRKLPSFRYWSDLSRVVVAINDWLREPGSVPADFVARRQSDRSVLED